MKICLIVEGSYPYVMGGVASWIQENVKYFSNIEFIIQTITIDRKQKQKFAYDIPDNIIEIREAYLRDEDYQSYSKKIKMSQKEKEAFQSLLYGVDVKWDVIFRFFNKGRISINAFLSSEAFLDMSREYYLANYPEEVFSDFLWTMRSMFLPLLSVINMELPEADLYHAMSTGYAGILGSMAKEIYKKPLLLSEHGIYTREREEEIIRADWVKGIYKDLWIQAFQKYSKCCYEYADHVTALFKEASRLQVECECDENKIVVIRNGMDASSYSDLPEKDPSDNEVYIGAILRITPIKDVKTLISAFAAAKREAPQLKLWIMGPEGEDEKYVQECKELIRIYGVRDIIFTGRVNIKEYIGKMDFLVLTSISEGQPLVILEGFAAKKPFITTNVGNCAGMIEGEDDDFGAAGIVTPVMSIEDIKYAMVYLAENETIRKQMGENGYKRVVAKYRIEDVHDAYEQLYMNLGGVK